MKLFGKKRTEGESTSSASAASGVRVPTHRLTLDLARSMDLATMLASSRASQFVEIPDFLAGVYLYQWDRISGYWPEERRNQVEQVLREICQISPQRWNYWIQLYDRRRREGEVQSNWERLIKPRIEAIDAEPPVPSSAFRAALETAERLTPFRDTPQPSEPEGEDIFTPGVPVVTTESLLLSIVKYTSSDSGRKLSESGLDIDKLERATLDPKRSPLR